jgi:hypothetical protein
VGSIVAGGAAALATTSASAGDSARLFDKIRMRP